MLAVTHNTNCLSFRFRLLYKEYHAFVGSIYNDGFIAELDATTWRSGLRGSTDPHISAPRDFAKDSKGNIISINAAGAATVTAKNARGTTYGGATRVLRASSPIKPGHHYLFLSIFDQGDRAYDSAVFPDPLPTKNSTPSPTGIPTTQ